jgi:hypothetical protein
MLKKIMDYHFLFIISCLIGLSVSNSCQCMNYLSSDKIESELVYSNDFLYLKISNNSDDSLYIHSGLLNKIRVYFNGEIASTDFLYSFSDLPPVPDPTLYDSLDHSDHRIADYINLPNQEKADSILFEFFIVEYRKLNKPEKIEPEERTILKSNLEIVMFLNGFMLFLAPHDSYTFKIGYNCFVKNPGRYAIKCKESRKKAPKYYFAHGLSDNSIIKLPNKPPLKFLGFTYYDRRLKCKTIQFITE